MQSFRNSNGKVIGRISGNVFEKSVKKSKHLLRKLNSWGIDKTVLDSLVRDGIQEIVIHEKEEKLDYSVSVKEFVQDGIEGDFGHSKQIFLPLVYFNKDNVN